MRKLIKVLKVIVAALVVIAAVGYGYFRYQYPYGGSHCCDIQLYLALHLYAKAHDGQFPAGEATPEASLSLLYRDDSHIASTLRGKTVPENVVLERLRRGELLTPETCGWHYVEGLWDTDNPGFAIFWDKVGLDHNGGRFRDGGHSVYYLDGSRRHIPEAQWPAFLSQQAKLFAERNKPGTPALQSGDR